MNSSAEWDKHVPLFVDHFLSISHLICALIGFPLNVLIVAFIATRRRLHQPRNILWLGIILSNLFILTNQVIELYTFFSASSPTGCKIRTWLAGLPYVTLLMNQLLALIDRYLSISRSVWYRQSVTIRWIAAIQFCCFALICLLVKGHYVFGVIPFNCKVIPPLDRTVFFSFVLAFFLLCVAGQVMLYVKTKTYLVIGMANDSGDTMAQRASDIALSVIQSRRVQDGDTELTTVVPSTEQTRKHYFVRIGNQTVSRLELEATRNVTIGVSSLCLFAFPWLVCSALMLTCLDNHLGQMSSETSLAFETCSNYGWAASYARELFVFHSIYHSVFYVARSRDFAAAISRDDHI